MWFRTNGSSDRYVFGPMTMSMSTMTVTMSMSRRTTHFFGQSSSGYRAGQLSAASAPSARSGQVLCKWMCLKIKNCAKNACYFFLFIIIIIVLTFNKVGWIAMIIWVLRRECCWWQKGLVCSIFGLCYAREKCLVCKCAVWKCSVLVRVDGVR